MTTVLAGVAGALLVAGVLLVIAGLVPVTGDPRRPRTTATTRRTSVPRSTRWRLAGAVIAGLVAWLVTRWPVAGVIVAVTVWGLPIILSTSRTAAIAINRVEALEEWTRRLSDVLVVGIGLEQAITATLRTCPTLIENEVTARVARMQARWSTERALRAFADDLDDATGDLVVATLVLGARRRGPGLARVLAAVADSVADDVAMRRTVEAERAKPRATARAVTLITLGVVVVGSLNGTYLAPYGTALGQLVLAVITLGFIASLTWMRSLTLSAPQPRLFVPGAGAGSITVDLTSPSTAGRVS